MKNPLRPICGGDFGAAASAVYSGVESVWVSRISAFNHSIWDNLVSILHSPTLQRAFGRYAFADVFFGLGLVDSRDF